ncbi:hypothetical protein Dsin_025349 [Dipteronia sinensis]|uniref:MATH domain-containing protein n=1 Tax=Dipteronia sinensis TaxID=43782 RepID=A0AAD9ZWS3_9ROSI|nr:hypothetical protein Dsin_025349 [Dipteronia sinensis]
METEIVLVEGHILRGKDALPSDYLIKIKHSSLGQLTSDKYCSDIFVVGGFKWILCIYPTGCKSKNVEDHISISLKLADTSSLPLGFELKVIFNFFLYNQDQNKYYSYQDMRVRHYNELKLELGIPKFIDIKTFVDQENGYVISDKCVFGA